LVGILQAEVNVQEVVLTEVDEVDAPVSQKLTVNARVAGPRLGKDVQTAIKASKTGDWSVDPVVAGGIELLEGEYSLETTLTEGHSASGLLADGGFLMLDLEITPALALEGIARDVIRSVQQARRDAGLDISDRIQLTLTVTPEIRAAVEAHRELIAGETLATTVELVEGGELGVAVRT
jgi:isoleucyl-tRNA synthetase